MVKGEERLSESVCYSEELMGVEELF